MSKSVAPFLLLALLGLAACDDPPDQDRQAAARAQAVAAEARRAAEEMVRAKLRIVGEMRLRAIQVYRQQMAGSYAVCGQINPSGAVADPFIPWVATVTLQNDKASGGTLAIGLSNLEASRVYLELVDRCFEGGGPRSAQAPSVSGLPPLPADEALMPPGSPLPPAASAPVANAPGANAPGANAPAASVPGPAPRAPAEVAARGTVTTTAAHPVNIRSTPGGGGIVRIVPRASALRVFGEAPGGWLQVGEEAPSGWVHDSMLER